MPKISRLKFGDIIVNHWAGNGNPHKQGVFVRNKKQTIELTDMKGNFWESYNDKEAKLEKIGNIFDDKTSKKQGFNSTKADL